MSLQISIPNPHSPYMPAARLLGVLAYPPRSAGDLRWWNAERALARAVHIVRVENDPDWGKFPQAIVPEYMTFPIAELDNALEEIKTRHHVRMVAAHVAAPFMLENERTAQGEPPTVNRRMTLRQRVQKVLEQEAERKEWLSNLGLEADRNFPHDTHNFLTRIYRPSLPIVHLAVAVGTWIDRTRKAARRRSADERSLMFGDMGGTQSHVLELLGHPEIVANIVAEAQAMEPFVPAPARGSAPKLVRLRMEAAESAQPEATAA